MSTKKDLMETLLDGLEQLISEGSNKNYWFSTRAIADAITALKICLPSTEFCQLTSNGLKHMLSESEISNDTLNWNEEVWDTSIAAMALTFEPVKYSYEIIKASNWIKSKYLYTHTSWNEEIWETLLALNSISYLHQNVPTTYDSEYDFSAAIEWLMKIVDTPRKGILINWSSTALFVLLTYSPALPSIARHIDIKSLQECADKCALTFLRAPILENEEILWTPEAWSNGLVLWALSVSKPGKLNVEQSFKIAKWFKERISLKDLPTEDRAFSCIGLYKYLELVEIGKAVPDYTQNDITDENINSQVEAVKEKLQENIAKHLKQRVSDFQSKPPFFSKHSFIGYYSINIKVLLVNVILIITFTFFFSFLTWKTQLAENQTPRWFVTIPIVLGTLATIAQLANFTLLPKKKQNKIDKIISESEEE